MAKPKLSPTSSYFKEWWNGDEANKENSESDNVVVSSSHENGSTLSQGKESRLKMSSQKRRMLVKNFHLIKSTLYTALAQKYTVYYFKEGEETTPQQHPCKEQIDTKNTPYKTWDCCCHLPISVTYVDDPKEVGLYQHNMGPVCYHAYTRHGGKWTIRLNRSVSMGCWEAFYTWLQGDTDADMKGMICGVIFSTQLTHQLTQDKVDQEVVFNTQSNEVEEDMISVWMDSDLPHLAKLHLRAFLRETLTLPEDCKIAYESHNVRWDGKDFSCSRSTPRTTH